MISLSQASVEGKRILVRLDLDVPLKAEGGKMVVSNDVRLRYALPTIEHLLAHKARIVILGHLGRPKGKPIPELSTRPITRHLFRLLRTTIYFCPDPFNPAGKDFIEMLQPGEICVVENLRFWEGEERNDPDFARALSGLGELYVNEAFATAHRAHASIVGIPKHLPAFPGFRFEQETTTLRTLIKHPAHPFVLIAGGAKISEKIAVLKHLQHRVDLVLTGGVMANTLMKAHGEDVGESVVDEEALVGAQSLLKSCGGWLHLPIDAVWEKRQIMDIGSRTIAHYQTQLQRAKTIFWNGNLGKSEKPPFDKGTKEIAQTLARCAGATTIVSGGDTGAVVDALGIADRLSFVSTGGGATLQFLAGKRLPALRALEARSA